MASAEQFDANVKRLIAQSRDLTPEARRKVLALLDAARKQILGELAGMDATKIQAAQLRGIKLAIDQAFDQFSKEAASTITDAQSLSAEVGAAAVEDPLVQAGLSLPTYSGLSTATLAIAQGYTADLISGLAKDSAAKLNAAIQRGFLGGQSMSEIIAQVGKALSGGQGFTGLFSVVGERAATITLNEILRVFSMSGQATLEKLSETQPALKKQWLHVPAARVPRLGHIIADGQVVAVADPFMVEGEELMYPRDPGGSPENTINCHCVVRPYFEAADLQPTAADKQFLKDLGISISVGA